MSATRSPIFLEISQDLLQCGCGVRFRVSGGSMHPTIQNGELITVAPVSASDLKRGDIVLYRRCRRVFAHRIVRIVRDAGGAAFLFRGDSADDCDAPVTPGQLLGRVIAVERNGRRIGLTGRPALLRWMMRAARRSLSRVRRNRREPVDRAVRVNHAVDHSVEDRSRHRSER